MSVSSRAGHPGQKKIQSEKKKREERIGEKEKRQLIAVQVKRMAVPRAKSQGTKAKERERERERERESAVSRS